MKPKKAFCVTLWFRKEVFYNPMKRDQKTLLFKISEVV